MIDINGMAHVILTVTQFEQAHRFYSALLPEFGMTKVNDGPDFLYHVGARTAIGIRRCDPEFAAPPGRWGDPHGELQRYDDDLSYYFLHKFVRNHVSNPTCSPAHLAACDYEQRAQIDKYIQHVGD